MQHTYIKRTCRRLPFDLIVTLAARGQAEFEELMKEADDIFDLMTDKEKKNGNMAWSTITPQATTPR